MFEIVADISTLITRQETADQECLNSLDAHKVSHPDVDMDDLIPSAVDRYSGGIKCECGCPTVGVESKSEGQLVRMCRNGLNVIKSASLVHKNPNEICYSCKFKYNPNGVVAGAVHVTHSIEDRMSAGILVKGMKSLIAAGLVEMDDADATVIIHDLSHTSAQHCAGCQKIRHSGCSGIGICPNAVEPES